MPKSHVFVRSDVKLHMFMVTVVEETRIHPVGRDSYHAAEIAHY